MMPGGFWLTVASTLTPSFGAWSAYSTDPVNDPYSGLNEPGFLASFGMSSQAIILGIYNLTMMTQLGSMCA